MPSWLGERVCGHWGNSTPATALYPWCCETYTLLREDPFRGAR